MGTLIVEEIQIALKELGFDCGVIDGWVGEKTRRALKNAKREHALLGDHVFGSILLGDLKYLIERKRKDRVKRGWS